MGGKALQQFIEILCIIEEFHLLVNLHYQLQSKRPFRSMTRNNTNPNEWDPTWKNRLEIKADKLQKDLD